MPLILGTNSIKDTGYNVANSLRVDRNSSAYLTRNESQDQSDGKKITISIWFKLGAQLGSTRYFFGGHADGSYTNEIGITSNDQLNFSCIANGTNQVTTNRVFRDPSAWYHVVAVLDSTQGTDTNRIKLYVNGVQETSFASSSYPSENAVTEYLKNGGVTRVGDKGSGGNNWDGYLTEVCVLDGQALDQNSFGEFDEDSPFIWKPKSVSGLTFGNNGFYLDFEDSSNLGNDVSGNNSDFSSNNLAATDQSTDTCTNNFATMNPLIFESSSVTFSEGNLKMTTTGSGSWTTHYGLSTIAVSSGKWFVEAKVTTTQTSQSIIGILSTSQQINSSLKDVGRAAVERAGRITVFGANNQTGLTTFNDGDIAAIAFDADNGTAQFYRNGSTYGSAITSIPSDEYYFATNTFESGGVVEFNFGSPPFSISTGNADGNGYGNFEYSVPSNYYALNTKNLAEYG